MHLLHCYIRIRWAADGGGGTQPQRDATRGRRRDTGPWAGHVEATNKALVAVAWRSACAGQCCRATAGSGSPINEATARRQPLRLARQATKAGKMLLNGSKSTWHWHCCCAVAEGPALIKCF